MKKTISIIAALFLFGCNNTDKSNGINHVIYVDSVKHDTVFETQKINYDSNARVIYSQKIKPTKENIEIGDTVVVNVIMHGGSVGVVRGIKGSKYYIDFFDCNCNNWYDKNDSEIMPYSNTWNRIRK